MVTVDLDHVPRPQNAAYDLGAYERQTVAVAPPAAPTNVRVVSN
jgi:hypothetical protein